MCHIMPAAWASTLEERFNSTLPNMKQLLFQTGEPAFITSDMVAMLYQVR